ncbi:unnamed protein product [Rhizophagus irregularis]|nr:unnamed protein product [Rhizophagus irregularis]
MASTKLDISKGVAKDSIESDLKASIRKELEQVVEQKKRNRIQEPGQINLPRYFTQPSGRHRLHKGGVEDQRVIFIPTSEKEKLRTKE